MDDNEAYLMLNRIAEDNPLAMEGWLKDNVMIERGGELTF